MPLSQKLSAPDTATVGDGEELTEVVTMFDVAVQPFASVVVTVYVPVAVTVMAESVPPLLHINMLNCEGLVTLTFTLPPVQKEVGPPAVMPGTTGVFSVIVTEADVASQPLASAIVTV